jgi:two-component system cell cycle response regulator
MDQVDSSTSPPLPALAQDLGSTPLFTVQILGFSSREQTLFASMFHLSKIRPMRYIEFDPDLHPYPDFFIVSTDNQAAIEQFSQSDRNQYGGALFIGNRPMRTVFPVIRKPIKWAEVLIRLDELPRPRLSAQIHELLKAGIISENDLIIQRPAPPMTSSGGVSESAPANTTTWLKTVPIESKLQANSEPYTLTLQDQANTENGLELESVNRWYDANNVKTFVTPPSILVVDEDPEARRYMAEKFLELNYEVDFAESGQQALELFKLKRYNAILMDVYLPGIDGYEVCRIIKSSTERRRTAIIFVASKHSTFDRVRGAMVGCDAYLSKPLSQDHLVETMDKFVPQWRLTKTIQSDQSS